LHFKLIQKLWFGVYGTGNFCIVAPTSKKQNYTQQSYWNWYRCRVYWVVSEYENNMLQCRLDVKTTLIYPGTVRWTSVKLEIKSRIPANSTHCYKSDYVYSFIRLNELAASHRRSHFVTINQSINQFR